MTLPQELQAARLRLLKERPYLASAAWALQPIVKPDLGTMAVDMYWRLYYDPAILAQWSAEVIEGVLYHEICHLLRHHADRMKDLDPRFSNIAADAEINDDLIRENIKLPTEPMTPGSIGQPDNLLAEEYYATLVSRGQRSFEDKLGIPGEHDSLERFPDEATHADKEKGQTKTDHKMAEDNGSKTNDKYNGKSRYNGQENGKSGCVHESEKTNSKHGNDNKGLNSEKQDNTGTPLPGSGRCGSCATGQKAPWEDGPPGKGSLAGVSQAEGELILRDVANQIKEQIRGRGRVPGHLVRWAEEKLHPKVDWRRRLASAVRYAVADTSGAADYSYRRPSRRQGMVGSGDVIFPSLRRPVPVVAVVVDTSASISDTMLAQALAEIAGILKSLGQKEGISVLAVDTAVASCQKVFRPEQVKIVGGGGTDMRVGIEAATKLRPMPQLGIVITDGHTLWPDHPPWKMRIITVLSGGGTAPDWADAIRINT